MMKQEQLIQSCVKLLNGNGETQCMNMDEITALDYLSKIRQIIDDINDSRLNDMFIMFYKEYMIFVKTHMPDKTLFYNKAIGTRDKMVARLEELRQQKNPPV